MRKNFILSDYEGLNARQDKVKFSMRGGFFVTFLSKQKNKRVSFAKQSSSATNFLQNKTQVFQPCIFYSVKQFGDCDKGGT